MNLLLHPQLSTDCQMNRIYQGKVTAVEIPGPGDSRIDQMQLRRYLGHTSLLSVSTAGRGAVSSETAPAFFAEATCRPL